MAELALIRLIRAATTAGPDSGVLTGIGDDTAVLEPSRGAKILATTDLLIEDVHFRRAWATPFDIGWKAMAVNLSDIAAKGGRPRWALVALALPAPVARMDVEALYDGMRQAAAPHGVVVVGGDTSTSPHGWFVNVTLLGEHAGNPHLRSAAKPGHAIAVTGALGRSAAGLAALEAGRERLSEGARAVIAAHLRPVARVAEGRWLATAPGVGAMPSVGAMIDLSDGLSADLGHICRESGVGARVALDRVPVDAAARRVARDLHVDPLKWAVAGGEDFELLLTCDPASVEGLADGLRRATGADLTAIGLIDGQNPSVTFLDAAGNPVAMPAGYEHFSG
jgi:thiamine-monophosphate kinase